MQINAKLNNAKSNNAKTSIAKSKIMTNEIFKLLSIRNKNFDQFYFEYFLLRNGCDRK